MIGAAVSFDDLDAGLFPLASIAPPFIVYALPRSRTAWLSRFLTYGDYECAHEQTRHLRTVDDARAWLSQDYTGTAETAAAPWWRLAYSLRPDARVLVVRRPLVEVLDSLLALNLRGACRLDRATLAVGLRRMDRALDQIERRVPGALSVRFGDLEREEVCARIFEHCLPYRHDHAWWASWATFNVQANMRALMRHAVAHREQRDRLTAEARQRTLRLLLGVRPRPAAEAMDGVVIAEESFETFWRDGQALFAEHAAEVGPREGVTLDINQPLVRQLEAAGMSQILTARCNGRMAGYVCTVISPAIEDASLTVGHQNTFYVSPDFRGIGPRLQRASIDLLRRRGVGEITMRAGVRGSGPKLGALYKRLGATEYGQVYNLNLRAA